MTNGTIIHFGLDDCHRILVLTNAGYAVESCTSLSQLRAALLKHPHIDAIVLAESDEFTFDEAASLIRWNCGAPVVLFEAQPAHRGRTDVALSVSGLTGPDVWLEQIRELIEFSHALPSKSRTVRSETEIRRLISKRAS
jgi:hypothetical protein